MPMEPARIDELHLENALSMEPAQSWQQCAENVQGLSRLERSYRPSVVPLRRFYSMPSLTGGRRVAAEQIVAVCDEVESSIVKVRERRHGIADHSDGQGRSMTIETTWTSISIFDRFLAATDQPRAATDPLPDPSYPAPRVDQIQSCYLACVSLAQKLHVKDLLCRYHYFEGCSAMVDGTASTDMVHEYEWTIAAALEWRLAGPTPFHFLELLHRHLRGRELPLRQLGDLFQCAESYVLTSGHGMRALLGSVALRLRS
jgi:hypothetical protein